MNQTTRQRITGSLVLAVTALVLLPVIFDGEGSYQPDVQPEIPPRPTQPQAALPEAQRPAITADSAAIRIRPETPATVIISDTNDAQSVVQPETDNTGVTALQESADSEPAQQTQQQAEPVAAPATGSTEAAGVATLDVQGLPEGWSVRLGSFASTENASNLVARLQSAGHRAYTRRIQSDQGMLTAVFVGPQVDRATAQTLMERLRQEFQLNGMVVRYEIDPL